MTKLLFRGLCFLLAVGLLWILFLLLACCFRLKKTSLIVNLNLISSQSFCVFWQINSSIAISKIELSLCSITSECKKVNTSLVLANAVVFSDHSKISLLVSWLVLNF